MALETGTFISDLVATNPTSTDPKAQGDDHLRLIKSTVKATFPNVAGAVTPTHTELNFVDGVTSAIQTQLDSKAPLASPTFTGTPTAPTASPGDNSTQIATTAFVVSQAFSSALPGQSGNNGRFLSTDGTSASWQPAVSSVGVSVPGFLSVSGTPVTSSGTIAISYSGTALPVANGGTGVTTSTGSGANVLSTNAALSGVTLNDGYTEEIFSVTGTTPALSPTNGSVQTWTLTGASTPTQGTWANGQSITLLIDDGTANTINWGSVSVTWKTNGGSAPTLLTTGLTVIQLWKVGDVVYGARVGDA